MKFYVFLSSLVLLFLSGAASSGVTSACESTLNVSGNVTTGRNALSEICYTRHQRSNVSDYTFLKWSGHWDNNSDKYMQPVTSWGAAYDADLNTNAGETGWRLPTIKELKLLADYSNDFDNSDASKVFGDNWMIRQWLLRSSASDSSLIDHGDAYLLSSTYFGIGADQKVMALHINTGEIKAVTVSSALKLYVLKTKEEEPTWQVWQNKRHANCLSSTSAVGTTLTTEDCTPNGAANGNINNTSTSIKWLYESNSGYIRSYDNKCVEADSFGNHDKVKINNCPTIMEGVNKYRWNRYWVLSGTLGTMYAFSNRHNTSYNLYDDNNDAEIYSHGTVSPGADRYGNIIGSGDEDAVWILKSN